MTDDLDLIEKVAENQAENLAALRKLAENENEFYEDFEAIAELERLGLEATKKLREKIEKKKAK